MYYIIRKKPVVENLALFEWKILFIDLDDTRQKHEIIQESFNYSKVANEIGHSLIRKWLFGGW
jgi:hypothetical protein